MRSHDNQELCFVLLERGASEQRTENRNIAEARIFVDDFPHIVPHESTDGEALPVSKLDRCSGPSGRACGDDTSLCAHGILKIQRGGFRRHTETDVLPVHDVRCKNQADAEFLKLNGDQSEGLRNRDWKLTACEKGGFLTIQGHQRWLGENFDDVLLL